MFHIMVYAFLILVTACQFQPPDVSGVPVDGAPGDLRDSSLGGAIDGGSDAGTPDAGTPEVDRGLVVRYFIDEAVTGVKPTQLADAAINPLALDVNYDLLTGSVMSFDEASGQRGLRWSSGIDTSDRASIAVDGTKVATALSGSTTGTIEVVATIVSQTGGGRLVDIDGADNGRFTLRTNVTVGRLDFYLNDQLDAAWQVPQVIGGRTVLHLVFDSNASDPNNAVILYANGVRLGTVVAPSVTPGATISLPSNSFLVLGNRQTGDRNSQQTIFYAALYSEALSSDEVATNSARLLSSDDTQP